MSASAHCPICFNHFPIDADKPEFVIFPCGHGFCESCTGRLFPTSGKTRCPNCRKFIHQRDGHPVYLQLVDSKLVFATKVIEGFGQMNTDTPVLSLKRASMKLGQVAKENPDQAIVLPLLKAIEDFNDRIVPNFTTVEKQKQEIEALRKELHRSHQERESMQTKLRKTESLQTEVISLRNALSESEANTQEAIRLAEVAKDDLGKVHETSGQWQRRAAELDQENKRFKDMLERHASIGRLQKEKNRKLHKQLTAMREERAEAEKATMSDALTHEYDGDFSGHEASRPQRSFLTITPSPSRAARRSFQDENNISLDFVGMPPPTFPSDWQIEPGVLKKRTINGTLVGTQRRVGGVFPLSLDRKGHPTKAVQLGPKSLVHVGR